MNPVQTSSEIVLDAALTQILPRVIINLSPTQTLMTDGFVEHHME